MLASEGNRAAANLLPHPGNQKTILGGLGRERLPKFRLSGNHVAIVGAFALKQRIERSVAWREKYKADRPRVRQGTERKLGDA